MLEYNRQVIRWQTYAVGRWGALSHPITEGRMIDLDPDARVLGFVLGLGDLNTRERCMGYQNACKCSECLERQKLVRTPRRRARQPWESETAA